MLKADKPLLLITMGDPNGIGAEVAAKALSDRETYECSRPVLVGDASAMEEAIGFSHLPLEIHLVQDLGEAAFQAGVVDVLDLGNVHRGRLSYGKVQAEAGKAAVAYIEKAVPLVLEGRADAIVTGPIHKKALELAGSPHAGHTEMLAALTGAGDYAMMLVVDEFRVVHVSAHVSLRQACDQVRAERILTVIRLTYAVLRSLGLSRPRIGVAGLNPHAGEEGLFGREEVDEILPAIRSASEEGILAEGPVPPDTLFAKTRGGQYDAAVAMYHDQGHIPVKTVGFRFNASSGKCEEVTGVNVTLGLPIVRTSVDHGVAFDRAGTGTANPQSMKEALRLAVQLSGGRQATSRPPITPDKGAHDNKIL